MSKFKELVTEEHQEQVMTVANRLREEGKLEGIEQGIVRGLEKGKLKIAKNLLTKNLDEILIAETTGLIAIRDMRSGHGIMGVLKNTFRREKVISAKKIIVC